MADEDLISALARNRLGRSGLAQWLRANYATLSPTMNAPRAPWVALARTAAERGLTIDGRPYTRQAVREAWKRVDRDMAAHRSQSPGPVATPVRAMASPPPPTIPATPLPEGTADERRRGHSFRRWNPATTDADIERLVGKPKPKS